MITVEPIARVAERVFRRAQKAARNAVDSGSMSRSEAEARMVPWLAAAAAAGADIPELTVPVINVFWNGPGPAPEKQRLHSSNICDQKEWLGVLSEAADAALTRYEKDASPENQSAARDLLHLRAHVYIAENFPPAIPERNIS